MLIVDAHVHTHRTEQFGLDALRTTLGPLAKACRYNGTPEDCLKAMEEANISKVIMVNFMAAEEMRDAQLAKLPADQSDEERKKANAEIDAMIVGRLQRYNQWTCDVGKEHPNLIPFINVWPRMDSETMRAEIRDKVKNHGAKGIKLHPTLQRYYPNDPRMWPCYETAQELGIPIMSDTGRPDPRGEPKHFAEVLDRFPKLQLVLAHLGGGHWGQIRALAKAYPNLNFDCAEIMDSYYKYSPTSPELISLIRKIGVERVMYGSDWPFGELTTNTQRIMRLDLTEAEKQLILSENAMRIYKLS